MSGQHVEDLAALYALGALDEHERSTVERHVARCTTCAAALSQAAEDVTTLALAQPQHAPPAEFDVRITPIANPHNVIPLVPRTRRTTWSPFLAAAAALLIAILPSAYLWQENRAMHEAMVASADAMARVASSPHRTVAFTGMPGSDARVMYAPDGSWYCVIVRGARSALHVAWMHDGEQTMLGTAQRHGDVAFLYLPKSHRMDSLALMDGERVVGQAQLVF